MNALIAAVLGVTPQEEAAAVLRARFEVKAGSLAQLIGIATLCQRFH
jgi:hypothetical protein